MVILRKLSSLDYLVLIFSLSALPALWVGYNWQLGIVALVTLAGGCLVYFSVSRLADREFWWRGIAGSLVILAGLIAVYFFYQLSQAAFPQLAQMASLVPAIRFLNPDADSVATFLDGVFWLCIPLAVGSGRLRISRFWSSLLLVILLALGLSRSAEAWLSILAAGCVWGIIRTGRLRWPVLAGFVFLVGIGVWLILSETAQAFSTGEALRSFLNYAANFSDRSEVIWNSVLLARDFPLTGIGLGSQFGMVYSRYQMLLPYVYLAHAHNLYVQIWLQMGLWGLAAWTGLITTALLKLRLTPGSPLRLRQEAAWIGLVTILVHGLMDARAAVSSWCWLPFFVLIGLLSAVSRAEPQTRQPLSMRWAPVVASLLAIALAVGTSPRVAALINQGALEQLHADFQAGMTPEQKKAGLARASTYYEKALLLNPNHPGANYRLGLIELDRFEFERSRVYFERALVHVQGHLGLEKALGLAYTFSGQLRRGQPFLADKVSIVNELNYWGWYFGTIQRPDVSENAYRQSLNIRLYLSLRAK